MKKTVEKDGLCRCMGVLCGAFFIVEVISVVTMLVKGIVMPFYGLLDIYLLAAFGLCTYKNMFDGGELSDVEKILVMIALALFIYFFVIGCVHA